MNRFMRAIITAIIALAALARPATAQTIIYVNAAAAPGGDGVSWATAFSNPQQALDFAVTSLAPFTPVDVWIAAGTYTPTRRSEPADPRSASLALPPTPNAAYPSFRLIGGFAGGESSIADRPSPLPATVLSGDLLQNDGTSAAGFANFGDNAYHVFRVTPSTSASLFLTLVDLTLSGGNANGFAALGHDQGGGLWVAGGFIELVGCTVERCYGERGAAIRITSSPQPPSVNVSVHHSVVRANGSPSGAFAVDGDVESQALFMYSSAVYANSGGIRMGCPTCSPGGFALQGMVGCTIAGNAASSGGPQVVVAEGARVFVADSIVWTSSASPVLRVHAGAAFELWNVSIKGGLDAIDFPDGPVDPTLADNVLQFDPMFADPNGADNIAGTIDDNYTLLATSPAVDQAASFATLQPPYFIFPRDAQGGRRFADANGDGVYALDWGAYEFGGSSQRPVVFVNAGLSTGADNGTSWADAYRGEASLVRALNSSGGGNYADVWLAQGDYLCNLPTDPLNPTTRPGTGFRIAHSARIYGGFVGTESSISERPPGGRSRVSQARSSEFTGPIPLSLFEIEGAGGQSQTFFWGELVLDGLSISDEDLSSGQSVLVVAAFKSAIKNVNVSNVITSGVNLFTVSHPFGEFNRDDCFAEFSGLSVSNFTTAGGGGLILSTVSTTVRSTTFDLLDSPWFGGAIIVAYGVIQDCRVSDLFIGNVTLSYVFYAYVIQDCVFERIGHIPGSRLLAADLVSRCEVSASSSFAGTLVVASRAEQLLLRHDPASDPAFRQPLDLQVESCTNCTLLGLQPEAMADFGVVSFNNSILRSFDGLSPMYLPVDLVNCVLDVSPRSDSPGTLVQCRVVADPLLDPLTARPLSGSPAIDVGCNILAPRDTTDLDLDGDVLEIVPIDLSGTVRVADDPQAPNAACPPSESPNVAGVGPIDAGAYEYAPQCPECPGERVWLDPAGGAFQDSTNWLFGVPNATHPTLFGLPLQYTVSFTGDAVSRRLRVDRGDVTLDLAGRRYDLIETGTASLVVDAPAPTRGESVIPTATLSVVGGGTLQGVYARIGDQPGNAGALTVSGAGTRVSFGQQGMCLGCAGSGSLLVSDGATFVARTLTVGELPGSFGSIQVSGSGSRVVVPFFLTLDRGSLTIDAGARVETGFGVFALQSARITGNGQLVGDVVNFGEIAPTSTTPDFAALTITGDYEQLGVNPKIGSQSGSLKLRATSNANAIQADQLIVNGESRLAGTLVVEPVGAFSPAPGSPAFSLLTSTTTIGRFDLAVFPGIDQNRFLRLAYPSPFERGGSVSVSVDTLTSNINLDPPSSANVGGVPTDIVAADFDNDPSNTIDLALTVPDAANPTTAPGTVVILKNAGNTGPGGSWAGFTGGQLTFNVGVNPRGLAKGDFNADGVPDLAVANAGSNTLTVLRNLNNGTGAMTTNQTISVGTSPVAVVTGVFRSSSTAIDVAVANKGSNTVTILNNTAGTLAASATLSTGEAPSDITAAQLDSGSSTLDLAVTNRDDDTVTVYYRPPGGGFNPSPSQTLAVGNQPVHIEPGGLDNPKEINDLTVTNLISGTVSILLNNGNSSIAAGFQPKADLPTGTNPDSFALGDLDNDGDPDLSVVTTVNNERVVRVFRNDVQEVSPGEFQAAFAPFDDAYAGTGPRLVIAGDVNSDGRDDLIAVNDQTLVFRPVQIVAPGAQPERVLVKQPNVSTSLSLAPNVPAPCPGDLVPAVGDNVVNTADLVAFLGQFGRTCASLPQGTRCGDFNSDNLVNTTDLVAFLGRFGQTCR